MIKKLIIGAIIALILVPAGVMAAGFGGQNAGAGPGQGQCLQDGRNCTDSPCATGGIQARHSYGGQNGEFRGQGLMNGNCTGEQKHTRQMLRLRDGTGTGCRGGQATP